MTTSLVKPSTWKEALGDRLAGPIGDEIEVFASEIQLRKAGRMDEKVFAETRLRRGAYGQRYDNGQRHDGARTQTISFPSHDLTKGPMTLWDAPGMQRIKIPFGGMNADQLDVLADLSEEYSDGICHVTTRQDIQLHFVHIEETLDLMRRLASVGITTREACGNVVRNVTACPMAGVCRCEAFDVTPYAKELAAFLLGHPDAQDFGRKFKVAFSGGADQACGLVSIHDLGFVAVTRVIDGVTQRGFAVYMGGGLGAVPAHARLYRDFLPVPEMLPLAQAICRVFGRLGERKNRSAARLKFLIKKLGWDEFVRLVEKEITVLPADARWTDWISSALHFSEEPLRPAGAMDASENATAAARAASGDAIKVAFDHWRSTNVKEQRQPGYAAVSVTLPLGDASAAQMRRLAAMARTWCRGTVRATVEQNLLFRWIPIAELSDFHRELTEIGLAEPGAETIVDVTSCPGTDTCKLGMASSRGLAAALRERLSARELQYESAVRDMRIKVSGCFNSCGHHHLADLGFYGSNRTVGGYAVPHFQVLLGGQWTENGSHYGLAIGAVPSKLIPEVVDRFIDRYLRERRDDESFRVFAGRIGKKAAREMIENLMQVPSHEASPDIYVDWADSREFTIQDLGRGECAGEVVSTIDFDLTAAERVVFEAQLKWESAEKNEQAAEALLEAVELAHKAMITAARGLVRFQDPDQQIDDDDRVETEFRTRYYDTKLFFNPFSGGKFAEYFFAAHDLFRDRVALRSLNSERVHQLVEEAQLFIEAAHACRAKLVVEPVSDMKESHS